MGLALFGGVSPAGAGSADARDVAAARRDLGVTTGVWLWTRRDADVLDRARLVDGQLRSAVHIATLKLRGDALVCERSLSPRLDTHGASSAVVIRLDDSIHPLWARESSEQVRRRLSSVLKPLLQQSEATGASFDEIELDYDAPVRVAATWAGVASALAEGPLRGRAVWVTSLPAHLDAPGFTASLAHAAVGQILQLFDTGLPCTQANYTRVASRLAAGGAPFRVGLGGFERAHHEGEHLCWALMARGLRRGAPSIEASASSKRRCRLVRPNKRASKPC